MDNDCSSELKEAMKNYNIDFQIAPPTCTDKIPSKGLFVLARIILFQYYPLPIRISLSVNGTV